MPELAEVEYYCKQWEPGVGFPIERVHLKTLARVFREGKPRKIKKEFPGKPLKIGRRHGKQMLFEFEPKCWLGVHLGMTGELLVADPDHKPEKHEHLVLFQADRALIFRDPRKFGRVRGHFGEEPPDWWTSLPAETTSREFTKERVRAALARHPKSVLKSLLLNQAWFPGIGNWMADEILWRTRLHPVKRCREVPMSTAEILWRNVREVSFEALSVIGTDWGDPPDTWLFNHRWKDGGICPRASCRQQLLREDVRGRTTCWCPNCQA
jgi:formamidopyrimidine-DNA glycosylase